LRKKLGAGNDPVRLTSLHYASPRPMAVAQVAKHAEDLAAAFQTSAG
jgi:hypothetical protein